MWDKMHEECGVIGVYTQGRPAAELVHRGLFALQHRGQEAAGIATIHDDGRIGQFRGRGLVAQALPTYEIKNLPGPMAIGHVRYSTVAADRTENIQPFVANTPFGRIAIAHNGNLKNTDSLTEELEKHGSILSTTMDTELFIHLMARSEKTNFREALDFACARAKGAYSLTILNDGKVYGLRDPHGIRPLVLGKLDDGWVLASESCALKSVGATFEREVKPGELVEISEDGVRSEIVQQATKPAPCVFELVYFARPDSKVFGQGVHSARTRMGEVLAEADAELLAASKTKALETIVVAVPDSGFPAAMGYAKASGLPLERAIIRSHYIGRTFILPDQDSRTHSLGLKLSVLEELVAGKRVILVDDSIVRGNTSRIIVEMVRDAGAKEVWMRIASPALSWPCYLGIDTPTKSELIANQHTDEAAIGEAIGSENLRYLSLEGLKNATLNDSFCFGCMTGDYPV